MNKRIVLSLIDSWPTRIGLGLGLVLLSSLIWTKIIDLFATAGFEAHGHCLLWIPTLITLYVGSDTSIGVSYVSISITLLYFVFQTWRVIPFQWIFISFGVFIIACGMTHFIDILTLWIPAYWLSGTVKLMTAIASVTTALALPLHLPKIVILIQQASLSEERKRQLEQTHTVLQAEVEKKEQNLVTLAGEVALRKRESQQAVETQRNFVAVVSHEFRTALTTIQGFGELIGYGEEPPGDIQEYGKNIFTEAKRLERMITNLLDLERMRSGKTLLVYEGVKINVLVKNITDIICSTTSSHSFRFQMGENIPPFLGDADKLAQVMSNLLSNAIKYSPYGEEILIGTAQEENAIHVWVQDQGSGIPTKSLEKIFTPYSRIENTRYIKGTGLGLSISYEIIQMHGGRIWAESQLGRGSCFHFTLPLST